MLTGPSGLTVELCYQRYGTGKNGWSVRWGQSEFCGRAVFLPIGRRQLFRPLLYTVKNILTWVMFAWYLSCSIDPSRGRRHDHLDGRTQTRQIWLHQSAWLPTAIISFWFFVWSCRTGFRTLIFFGKIVSVGQLCSRGKGRLFLICLWIGQKLLLDPRAPVNSVP